MLTDRASTLADDFVDVSCPLCDGTNLALYLYAPSHYGPEKLRITRCCACGMLFTNPQSASYETRVNTRGVLERHFSPPRLDHARLLASFHLSYLTPLAPGRRILDFGCGEGAFVRQAQHEGWTAVGVDLNSELVYAANEYWRFNALHSLSLDDLLRTGWVFDAIYSNQVFEHLRRPVETGCALVNLLAPGGVIFLDVPNARQAGELLKPGSTLDPTSHSNHFTIKTLSHLVERVGCRPIYESASPGLIIAWRRLSTGPWAISLATLTRRLLPSLGSGVCVIGRKHVSTA